MKNIIRILMVLIMAVLTANAVPAYADRGGHWGGRGGGHIGFYVGPGWGWGWGPGWWGYPYYPYYPYYQSPPVVVQPQPEVYVQQPAPQAESQSYWYFCQDPKGYYPYVKKCPKGWMKVVPPANGPEGEE
jgi:hypothetical protein